MPGAAAIRLRPSPVPQAPVRAGRSRSPAFPKSRHPRGAFAVELRALRSHEAAQGFNVIGKRGSRCLAPKTCIINGQKCQKNQAIQRFFNPQVGDASSARARASQWPQAASPVAQRSSISITPQRSSDLSHAPFDDATMSLSRLMAARFDPRKSQSVLLSQIAVANSANFTVKQLPTPCIKLAAADPVPLNRARHRGTRREGFANDRELLLHRPVAPSRNAPDNLNTRLRTTHTTGRMTARIRIALADHFALRTWNAQTAQSAQTMQGGPQSTLISMLLDRRA
jgi:hypothetical protein